MSDLKKFNLFVIGAMKSGSTSLHYYLADHPEIFMCEPKEPWYFVKEKNWSRGENWYHSLFKSAPDHIKIIGESSADYTMMPKFLGIPERIASYNPDARFIYVLRDPIIRSISHYWHNVRWHGEQRDMLTAVQEDSDLLDFSNYYLQLSSFHKFFPRERFFVFSFEEMISKPNEIISTIYDWIGVDNNFLPPSLYQAHNVTPRTVHMIRGLGLLHKFRHSTIWNKTHQYLPAFVKHLGKKMATREISKNDQPMEETINFLRPIFQEQVNLLQSLLNRSFPEWDTLHQTQDRFEI